jgi:hypothetical protein
MKIGDLVLHDGRRYYLRGLDPMSVPTDRRFSRTRSRVRRARSRSARSSLCRPERGPLCAEFEPVPCGYDRSPGRRLMYEMVIYGVSFDLVGKQPIVLLKTADGNKFLPHLDRAPRGGLRS